MKVFVINLEKDVQRRESITLQLENQRIESSIQKAVYGKMLSREEIANFYNDKKAYQHQCRSLTSSEIGCSLSHIEVYRKIIAETIPFACILEDDVILPENFKNIMDALKSKIEQSIPQVILLSPAQFKENIFIPIDEKYTLKQYKSGYYTSSYIINQLAAKILLKKLFPVNDVADCWRRVNKHKFADIKIITPTLIEQDLETFGSSTTDDYHKTFSYNKIQILKFKFCRAFWLSYDGILAIYNRNFRPYGGISKEKF